MLSINYSFFVQLAIFLALVFVLKKFIFNPIVITLLLVTFAIFRIIFIIIIVVVIIINYFLIITVIVVVGVVVVQEALLRNQPAGVDRRGRAGRVGPGTRSPAREPARAGVGSVSKGVGGGGG